MQDNDKQGTDDGAAVEADGAGARTAQDHQRTDYLEREVNLLKPSTPFMRDHLRVIWTGFIAWVVLVFGPVTLTAIAPELMTSEIPGLDFPLHYFLVAVGAPGGALLLSVWYARERDRLDEKYGIEHATEEPGGEDAVAADGGVEE